jgi:hypothetical protein
MGDSASGTPIGSHRPPGSSGARRSGATATAGWSVIGVVIYAAYGYRHGKLGQGQAVQTKDT